MQRIFGGAAEAPAEPLEKEGSWLWEIPPNRSIVRHLLDGLGRDSLVRLGELRALPPARSNDDRRARLARSYRGELDTLLSDLRKADLVDLLRDGFVHEGKRHRLQYLASLAHDELRGFYKSVFAEQAIPRGFSVVLDETEGERIQEEAAEEEQEEQEEESPDEEQTPDEAPSAENDPAAANLVLELGTEWSRPRKLTLVLQRLGMPVPQRLHTKYFHELIEQLQDLGVEVQHADGTLVSAHDSSPGISAKLRLRRASKPGAETHMPPVHIVVTQGGDRAHQQFPIAASSAFELAHLRLQLLTAIPSLERQQGPNWPMDFLVAAQKGLVLSPHHQQLLAKIALTYGRGTHDPYGVVLQLGQRTRTEEWPTLLSDFARLNRHQPEVVAEVLRHIRDLCGGTIEIHPKSGARPSAVQPKEPLTQSTDVPANHRDLGALSRMFDDD